MASSDPFEILARIESHLLFLQRMGLRYAPALPQASTHATLTAPANSSADMATDAVDKVPSRSISPGPPLSPALGKNLAEQPDLIPLGAPPSPPQDRPGALAEVARQVALCRRCKLCAGRTHTVPGEGNPRAALMFIGEGPGYNEDQQGRPFVGRAGQLLTRMIEAMGYQREQVFIGNIVKCRPPGNRDPEADEIEQCEPYLKRQLEIIQPRVIVGLGRVAVQTLLKTKTPISRLRGTWHKYIQIDFMPTYHPAYLLRNPAAKRPCWEDLQAVITKLKATQKN